MTKPDQAGDDLLRRGEALEIGNEFARVRVTKVWTHCGERLEIEAVRLGYVTRLDAIELESLTWQTPETLSRLLEEPYGPPPTSDTAGPDSGL